MIYQLEDFQEKGVGNLAQSLTRHKSVLAVSPGGSGKSVIIATVSKRFIDKSDKDVLVLVHKKELLDQTREKFKSWYNILTQKIDDKTVNIQRVRVFVGMVETFDRRASTSSQFRDFFKNVGLLILDEAHLSNFNKIFIHFLDSKRIGFTATPISAVKKDPIKNYYDDIVVISKPTELLHLNEIKPERGIVPCLAWSLENVKRSSLKVRGDEFDEDFMGSEFSKPQQIENTLNAYLKHAYGTKTMCFNANISHSLKMHEAFLNAGLNSRHLDSKKSGKFGSDKYREDTFKWFMNEPDAILNNIGIATTGYDNPTIQTIILNSSMMSLTLHIQKSVRGSRPCIYPDGTIKKHFLLLDMGNNIPVNGGNMGTPNDDIDWDFIFKNPKLPKPGIGIVKSCPECGALNPVSARICSGKIEVEFLEEADCGYMWPQPTKEEDLIQRQMVQVRTGINVKANIEYFKDRREYFSWYETMRQIAKNSKSELASEYLDSLQLQEIYNLAYDKSSEWYKLKDKRKPPTHRHVVKEVLLKELKDAGFMIPVSEIEELELDTKKSTKSYTNPK